MELGASELTVCGPTNEKHTIEECEDSYSQSVLSDGLMYVEC